MRCGINSLDISGDVHKWRIEMAAKGINLTMLGNIAAGLDRETVNKKLIPLDDMSLF